MMHSALTLLRVSHYSQNGFTVSRKISGLKIAGVSQVETCLRYGDMLTESRYLNDEC